MKFHPALAVLASIGGYVLSAAALTIPDYGFALGLSGVIGSSVLLLVGCNALFMRGAV